jgi:UDP-N-acetylglucosamine 4,6-dehydratase/5-epimerase
MKSNIPLSPAFANRILLVTGGTGSFGRAVLNHALRTDISEIRVFSRDEKKQEDLRRELSSERVKFYIGDVRDFDSIGEAMHGVDYVFSAAALKQVPSCEFYPMEAVKTNILGADNVLRAAQACRVSRVVVLSTDKAVSPINAMGISKAMMEKVMVARSRGLSADDPVFCGTRYGNVMGSRGSVIPLFIGQIRAGQAITITEPTMTRFMMSIEEAVDLVLYALQHGRQGDIFVQKAPAATIEVLATALKRIFRSEVPVRVLGIRHGEKLHESLVSREELSRAEDLGGYFRINPDTRDLNYDKFFDRGDARILGQEDYTSANTEQLGVDAMAEKLLSLPFVRRELTAAGVVTI